MSQTLRILNDHNTWSTRLLLEQCRSMTKEEFHRHFPIGHESLHANLTHIIGAMRRWSDRVAARELRPSIERPPEATDRSPDRLLLLLDEAHADLAGLVTGLDEGAVIDFSFESPTGRRTITVTRLEALLHLYTHGQHHRSQCFNMLRHLGYPSESGDHDVLEWTTRRRK